MSSFNSFPTYGEYKWPTLIRLWAHQGTLQTPPMPVVAKTLGNGLDFAFILVPIPANFHKKHPKNTANSLFATPSLDLGAECALVCAYY